MLGDNQQVGAAAVKPYRRPRRGNNECEPVWLQQPSAPGIALRFVTRERRRTDTSIRLGFLAHRLRVQIGAGHAIEEVLADYPYLEREDILQALRCAAWRVEERELILPGA
jgi:Protein of unknown function (DUF433)